MHQQRNVNSQRHLVRERKSGLDFVPRLPAISMYSKCVPTYCKATPKLEMALSVSQPRKYLSFGWEGGRKIKGAGCLPFKLYFSRNLMSSEMSKLFCKLVHVCLLWNFFNFPFIYNKFQHFFKIQNNSYALAAYVRTRGERHLNRPARLFEKKRGKKRKVFGG